MSRKHGAREQKRLAKQNAKRSERRREIARQTSNNPAIRLQSAHAWPVIEALIPENLWEFGIGQLVIARTAPQGQIAVGIFLVDVFCLGVKNATWHILSKVQYDTIIDKIEPHGELYDYSPDYFCKLVYRAVDYAQSLGFAPNRDFHHARLLLEGIDPSLCPDEFEFGRGGKPFYVRGPHESIAEAQVISARIRAAGGHYMIPLRDLEEGNFEVVAEDDEADDDARLPPPV